MIAGRIAALFAAVSMILMSACAPEGGKAAGSAKALLEQNTCLACHRLDGVAIGPAFVNVAERYGDRPDAVDYIAGRIASGSTGHWGSGQMPSFAALDEGKRKTIAKYILSLAKAK